MSEHYLLIASRDPYTHAAAGRCYELAAQLADEGQRVTLFLVQNGVLPARPGAAAAGLPALSRKGVRVLADAFSLRERGIAPPLLAAGVEPASLEVVIEALEAGAKVLWH
jgi:sulfur relay (sulfurtransferase) complex TusBCD TusD component (DsrE family)